MEFALTGRGLAFVLLISTSFACESRGSDETVGTASAAICRQVELVATKTYGPDAWMDDTEPLSPPITFRIPNRVGAEQGAGGLNGTVTLTIARPTLSSVSCIYVSEGPNTYGFGQCDNGFVAFQSIEAESVTLHVNDVTV
jgi:hypothetical protein